ncbi:MAG: hypothetical protein NC221_04570 [Duncaniella sp.]|nr:hypothetical protein [Muribaculum sp.]MCM1255373.1 hypothetical protein [Duncaniella sp.]
MPTKTPAWMTILIIIVLLPIFSIPALLNQIPPEDDTLKTITWCYPFYLLLSGYLAWFAYPQRPYISWILIALMVLSSIAVWMLPEALL